MRQSLAVLAAAAVIVPAQAFAQMFVAEPAYVIEEPVIVEAPGYGPEAVLVAPGGLVEEDAVAIAMMHGLVSVSEVDEDWDGDFKVDGKDASGDDVEITVDGETGAVVEIDG